MFLFLAADELMQKERSPLPGRMLKTALVFAARACAPLIVVAAHLACIGMLGHAVSATIVYPIRLLSQAGGEIGYGQFYGSRYRYPRQSAFIRAFLSALLERCA